ncbi:hypothetical protein FsymDg_2781 [Candidatus Protofrankia datiscae]|uniref:Uncharacterized protein n=1 Tax=Candidatus Protofrankia datiscae TaxID=2716812 RepID=F8B623_9ACTN|nr:hypothetical protein FsymDg_2781 [Candidatus Protofrankia datiscae]
MSTTVLNRETCSDAEAARLLRLPQSTLGSCLEGGCGRAEVTVQ